MKSLFLSFLFSAPLCVNAQLYGWDSDVYLPAIGRDDGVCFTMDQIIFIGTGNHGGFSESNLFYAYNTRNDTWQDVAPFPGTARQYATAEVIDFTAYLIGGIDEFNIERNDVWKYDLAEDNWTQLADFPGNPRWKAASFVIDDILYYGTGQSWTQSFNDFWKYDPETDTWTQLNDLPILPRNETVYFSVYNHGYLGLGIDCTNVLQKDFWRFDPELESWQYETDFPAGPRFYAVASSLNGYGYVGTGEDSSNTMKNDFWQYDPSTKIWEQAENLPFPARRGVAACALPFKAIYFANGLSDSFERLTQISRYTNRNFSPSPLKVFYQFEEKKLYINDLPAYSIIRLVNPQGKLLFESFEQVDHIAVDVTGWANGVYIVWIGERSKKFMLY